MRRLRHLLVLIALGACRSSRKPAALGVTARQILRLSGAMILGLAGLGTVASGQLIAGRVTRRDGAPIPDVSVFAGDSVGGGGRNFRSDALGRFRVKLDVAGTFVLRVRRLGYRPFVSPSLSLKENDSLSYDVQLDPVPQQLAMVTVNAEIDAIRDLQMLGFGIRSIPATIIGPSQIEVVGRDAHTYVDVLRKIRLPSVNIDETCVRYWRGTCLKVYLNDRLLGDGAETIKQTQFVIDPNEIDHIVYVRVDEAAPSDVLGSLFIYTRAYTDRQRRLLRKPVPDL